MHNAESKPERKSDMDEQVWPEVIMKNNLRQVFIEQDQRVEQADN